MIFRYRLTILAVLILFISAMTVCPVMAVTDTIKSVEFDDFCLQYVMNPLDEWNDGKICSLYRYCIRDDACWDNLSDKLKEKGRECSQTLIDVIRDKDKSTDNWREQLCNKRNYCNLNEKGWINNPVILQGHLEIESIENKDTFRVIMKFTPKTLSTYGKTFYLTSKEQKRRILFDKTISISDVSDSEQKFQTLITEIIAKKKEVNINDIFIIIDTTQTVWGVINTLGICLSIPIDGPIGTIGCISGIGKNAVSIGIITYKIQSNNELKIQIKNNIREILNDVNEDL